MASDDFSIATPTYRVPQRGRGMDAGTRRLAIIAAGLGVALLSIVGGYSAMHRHHGAVPLVQADKGPTRFKPDNPGGMQVAGAANEVFSGGSDTDVGKLAPPPETPAPQPRTPPAAAPVHAANEAVAPLVATPAEPAKPAAKPIAVAAKPATAAPTATKPAVVAATAAPTTAKPAAVTTTAAKPEKTGKAAVQLAAFPTEDAAKTEWQRLQKHMPDVFGSRQPAVSKTERDGRTWWRLRTGGFADATQAVKFCENVRAKGATCSVADF